MEQQETSRPCAGVILAGGEGRRFGEQDKPFVTLCKRPLVLHSLDRVLPQVSQLVLSINGDPCRFAELPLTTLNDRHQPPRGPLEGLLTAMSHYREAHTTSQWLFSAPVDCPFVPLDLAARLYTHARQRGLQVCYAADPEREHVLCAVWMMSLEPLLKRFLETGERAVYRFLATVNAAPLRIDAPEAFLNINQPQDVQRAQSLLQATPCTAD